MSHSFKFIQKGTEVSLGCIVELDGVPLNITKCDLHIEAGQLPILNGEFVLTKTEIDIDVNAKNPVPEAFESKKNQKTQRTIIDII